MKLLKGTILTGLLLATVACGDGYSNLSLSGSQSRKSKDSVSKSNDNSRNDSSSDDNSSDDNSSDSSPSRGAATAMNLDLTYCVAQTLGSLTNQSNTHLGLLFLVMPNWQHRSPERPL